MKKKILAGILTLLMLFCSCVLISCDDENNKSESQQQTNQTSDNQNNSNKNGDYEFSDAISISTKEDFVNMFNSPSKNYILANDINLGDWSDYGIKKWDKDKIEAENPFTGYFNGNNKTITYSMRITWTDRTTWAFGLFYAIRGATIENLNVQVDLKTFDPQQRGEKWDISNDDCGHDVLVGGIVGYAYGSSTIKNCTTSGTVKYNSDGGGGDTCVGGIVGYNYASSVVNSGSSASVYARGFHVSVGGVVGCNYSGSNVGLTFNGEVTSNNDWLFGSTHKETLTIGRSDYKVLAIN